MAVCAAGNSLGKLSLDAVIQRDVDETLRSSAFARSETFLQLAWVVGAAVALLLPANKGQLDMSIAAVFLGVATVVLVVRSRSMAAATARAQRAGESARDVRPAAAESDEWVRDEPLPDQQNGTRYSDGSRDADGSRRADGPRHPDNFRYPEPGQPGSATPGPGTV